MKKLILILIIIFNFSLAYGQTAIDVSNKLSPLTQKELSEVSKQIDTIMVRAEEKLIESKDSVNGQLLRSFQTLDRNGKKVSGRKVEWAYYPSGPVDMIITTKLDANDKTISTERIKHYLDGRQPEVIK